MNKDVSEWLANGGSKEKLLELVARLEGGGDLPVIEMQGGKLHLATDAALAALARAGAPFYQRDCKLVRVCRIPLKLSDGSQGQVPAVVELEAPTVKRTLAHTVVFKRYDAKQEKLKSIDPPGAVIEQMLSMLGEWPFAPLRGVISTPTIRHDGSLLLQPGYDEATGLVLFDPPHLPAIPEQPTREDAVDALALLEGLLDEFSFETDAGVSKSAALSMLITPVLRGAMPVAPMHVISKPVAGTGASYLQDLVAALAIGERCPVVSFSSNGEENDKRLMDAAISQQPIIAIDNVTSLLMSGFLCQLIERPVIQPRKLGAGLVTVVNSACVFANGNNLVIGGSDTVRRTIRIGLDANMEDPETREFRHDPVAEVMAERGKYIAAILTIARAYCIAGKPDRKSPLASFSAWSDLVRSPLLWLGRADALKSMEKLRQEDPVKAHLANFFHAWMTELSLGSGYKTSELISLAGERKEGDLIRPNLAQAIADIATNKSGHIDPAKLGLWLRQNVNRITGGCKLWVDTRDHKRPEWSVSGTM